MKIVYAGVKNDLYNPKRGMSFEFVNFYLTLSNMKGVRVIEYPFDKILEVGKKKFNQELLDIVRQGKPDLFFAFMYTDELDPLVLTEIKKKTTSVAWFADDYWRFFNYSKHWPPYFSRVITTYSKAVDWYKKAGYENVILSQWACNTALYKPVEAKKDIDVSFVGQRKSGRVKVVEALRRAGIDVRCFGFGWPRSRPARFALRSKAGGPSASLSSTPASDQDFNQESRLYQPSASGDGKRSGIAALGSLRGGPNGKISHEEMLKIFGRSKICLNLTDRKELWDPSVVARLFLKKSVNRIVPDFHFIDNLRAYLHFPVLHTHARPFELAGCRAFVISGWSEDIGKFYDENKEMVFYKTIPELINKIRYFLPREREREEIAWAAYKRTIRDHTYEKRFGEIFKMCLEK